ncbi:MAG: NAD(P)-dependent oxidoreductase [candidate division WOR-3 bacterium]
MKILLVGKNGLLGSEFDRIIESNKLSLSRNELDITKLSDVLKVVKEYKPNVIINCSAISNVDYCEENIEQAILVNTIGVENLLISAIETKALIVHFSTDYVFDGNKNNPYTIYDIPNPINIYGISKLLSEKVILNSGYENYLIIRTSWLFGKGRSSFITKILNLLNQDVIYMTGQISNPTYVKDLAQRVMKMIFRDYRGLFHLTGSLSVSRYELTKFILGKFNYRGKIILVDDFPSKAKRPKFSSLDNYPLEPLRDYKSAIEEFLSDIIST